MTIQDEEIAKLVLKKNKPTFLAINKADDSSKHFESQFYSLGIAQMMPVSALHGNGLADLLEMVLENYTEAKEEEEIRIPKVAIIGRPNVGKSTLMNSIVGEHRCVVSNIPGTTRDTIDEEVNGVLFIDTAGLKRKQQEKEVLDKFARIRTETALERSDICVLVIDVLDGITSFEKTILQMIEDKGKGFILFVNKWDLVKDCRMEHVALQLRKIHPVLEHVPILIGSAHTGRNVKEIYSHISRIYNSLQRRVPTGELNTFLERAMQRNHPSSITGKRLRIYYLTQVSVGPPQFVLFVNDQELLMESYRKYLVNQFRDAYDFLGCPIRFKLKTRKRNKYKFADS